MTLEKCKSGEKIRVKDIKEKNLNSRLLSLGLCKGDDCTIENIANGNVLLKTLETKIVISDNLAEKIEIEVLK
mgnify:FL=1